MTAEDPLQESNEEASVSSSSAARQDSIAENGSLPQMCHNVQFQPSLSSYIDLKVSYSTLKFAFMADHLWMTLLYMVLYCSVCFCMFAQVVTPS